MFTRNPTRALLGIVALVGCAGVAAAADSPDALTIIKQMKAALEPARASVRQLTFTMSVEHGERVSWTAVEAGKVVGGDGYILMVMLAPTDAAGIAWLVQRGEGDKSDTEWIYMPTLRRTRKLTGPDAYEAFLGTDFTHADLGFESVRGTFKLAASGKHDGVAAYRVEAIPADRWYYQRILTWVDAATKLPMERAFYDASNTLWKTERYEQVTTIEGLPTPLRIVMRNEQTGDTSEIQVKAVRYDVDVPDALFDPDGLRAVPAAPVWKTLGPR